MRRLLPVVLAVVSAAMTAVAGPPASGPAPTSGTSIGTVAKEHGVEVEGGRQAVRLTIPVDTFGMKGRTLAVVVFFEQGVGVASRVAERALPPRLVVTTTR